MPSKEAAVTRTSPHGSRNPSSKTDWRVAAESESSSTKSLMMALDRFGEAGGRGGGRAPARPRPPGGGEKNENRGRAGPQRGVGAGAPPRPPPRHIQPGHDRASI